MAITASTALTLVICNRRERSFICSGREGGVRWERGSGWDAAAAMLPLEKPTQQQQRLVHVKSNREGRRRCLRCFHTVIFTGRDPEMLCVMPFFNPPHPTSSTPTRLTSHESTALSAVRCFMISESRRQCPPVIIFQPV